MISKLKTKYQSIVALSLAQWKTERERGKEIINWRWSLFVLESMIIINRRLEWEIDIYIYILIFRPGWLTLLLVVIRANLLSRLSLSLSLFLPLFLGMHYSANLLGCSLLNTHLFFFNKAIRSRLRAAQTEESKSKANDGIIWSTDRFSRNGYES